MSFVIVCVYVVLAGVITLVLVLRHSIENLSNELLLGKEKSTTDYDKGRCSVIRYKLRKVDRRQPDNSCFLL